MFNYKLYEIEYKKTSHILQEQISFYLILIMKYLSNSFDQINIDEKLCLTIGNFDGIHKGHREIIKNLIQQTKKSNLKSAILSFLAATNVLSLLSFKRRTAACRRSRSIDVTLQVTSMFTLKTLWKLRTTSNVDEMSVQKHSAFTRGDS